MTRTWLVTGSSSGFGLALAQAAVAAGDNVVATARRIPDLDSLVAYHPSQVLAVEVDVLDTAQIKAAVAEAVARFGSIDVVVNNAGIASVGAVEELRDDDLRMLMDVMFFGPLAVIQAVLPGMRERGSGTIVQMSSMGGQLAMPGFGAYCAAKFALEGLSEALAAEVAPHGISVLIVEPGAFATRFGGQRTQISPDSGAYSETVGATRKAVQDMDGSQPGDPQRAAQAILQAVESTEPPLRLALGEDAVTAIGQSLTNRQKELAAWAALSTSTARSPGTPQ